jgi:LEA14-like dessication related protein
MNANRVLGCLSLILSAGAIVGCQPAKPTVSFSNVAVTGFTDRGVDLDLTWQVDNPNPVGLRLTSMDYALSLEQRQLLSGASGEPVSVPAMGSSVVRTPVSVSLADLAALSAARDDWLDYQVDSTLVFDVMGADVPISVNPSGQIARVQPPRMRLADLRLDPAAAAMEIDLAVENPNAFALPSATLNGALRYGQAVLARLDDRPTPAIAPGASETITLTVSGGGFGAIRAAREALAGGGSLALDGGMDLAEPVSLLRGIIRPD